jgi:hypothetical protein
MSYCSIGKSRRKGESKIEVRGYENCMLQMQEGNGGEVPSF